MLWKTQNANDYLIRTSVNNSQKSLGPRSEETEAIFRKFTERKKQVMERLGALRGEMARHQRMNRALRVGRTPKLVIEILNRLHKAGLADHLAVIDTHAIYAYETAAGVRISSPDVHKKLTFETQVEMISSAFTGALKKADRSFEIRSGQHYTAINSQGFEVDVIFTGARSGASQQLRMNSKEDEDLYAGYAKKTGYLLGGPMFSSIVVSSSGHMARMNTISPISYSKFKRWIADRPNRGTNYRQQDILQANIVEELVRAYLPHVN